MIRNRAPRGATIQIQHLYEAPTSRRERMVPGQPVVPQRRARGKTGEKKKDPGYSGATNLSGVAVKCFLNRKMKTLTVLLI